MSGLWLFYTIAELIVSALIKMILTNITLSIFILVTLYYLGCQTNPKAKARQPVKTEDLPEPESCPECHTPEYGHLWICSRNNQ